MVFILGTAVEAHTNFDGGAHAHRCLSEPTFNNIIISLSFLHLSYPGMSVYK